MKEYLAYLKKRIYSVPWNEQDRAVAEYNRALAFAQRHGLISDDRTT